MHTLASLPLDVRHIIFDYAGAREIKPKKVLRFWFEKQEAIGQVAELATNDPAGSALNTAYHDDEHESDNDVEGEDEHHYEFEDMEGDENEEGDEDEIQSANIDEQNDEDDEADTGTEFKEHCIAANATPDSRSITSQVRIAFQNILDNGLHRLFWSCGGALCPTA